MNKELLGKLKTNSLTDEEALELYNSGVGVPFSDAENLEPSNEWVVSGYPVEQGLVFDRLLTDGEKRAIYEGSGPIYDRLVTESNDRNHTSEFWIGTVVDDKEV